MTQHPAPGAELPFEGGRNFRELGGYPAADGRHVRRGLFYRGIATAGLVSEADRALLESLGLRAILDLRSSREAAANPDRVPPGAQLWQQCALCAEDGHEISFSPEDIALLQRSAPPEIQGEDVFVRGMYCRMLFGNPAFRLLFRLLEEQQVPLLFHCTAGKDRTGVAAMLILLALGASDQTICADYEKTNLCRAEVIRRRMEEHADEIAADPSRAKVYQGMEGVDPAVGPFVLDQIRRRYGSAEAYLEAEFGLDAARLARLRQLYLE